MSFMPGLPIRPPLIVHHMAALDAMIVPQNSLEAIAACLDAGAAVVEVDITALADGDYLLVHDPLLESETSGRGRVADCTLEQARLLTLGGYRRATAVRVPLLSEVMRLIDAHAGTTHLQLDFKNEAPFASDEPLQRLIHLIEPLGSRVLVSSGADWQLRRLHRLAPWLALGFDPMGYLDWEPAGGTPSPSAAANAAPRGARAEGIVPRAAVAPSRPDGMPTTGSREPAGGTPQVSRAAAAPSRPDGMPMTGSHEPAGGTPQVSRAAVPMTGSHEPPGTLRDPREHPQRRGVHGYYDDHPLAVMDGWPAAAYLADRCESLMSLVPAVSTFYIRHTLLAQSLSDGFNWAQALHRKGIQLDAWTVDVSDPVALANAPRLLAAGVDMFTTNTPKALAQMLSSDTEVVRCSGVDL